MHDFQMEPKNYIQKLDNVAIEIDNPILIIFWTIAGNH